MLLASCTQDEFVGLVNGCDHSIDAYGYLGDGNFGWIELDPSESVNIGNFSLTSSPYPARIRGRLVVHLRLQDEGLVAGSSGDWDREYVLTETDCKNVE